MEKEGIMKYFKRSFGITTGIFIALLFIGFVVGLIVYSGRFVYQNTGTATNSSSNPTVTLEPQQLLAKQNRDKFISGSKNISIAEYLSDEKKYFGQDIILKGIVTNVKTGNSPVSGTIYIASSSSQIVSVEVDAADISDDAIDLSYISKGDNISIAGIVTDTSFIAKYVNDTNSTYTPQMVMSY